MKTVQQTVGKRGEDEACAFLRGLGQRILARNWRSSHLEMDIVTVQGNNIHFVEVKTLRAPALADPVTKVNRSKMERMTRAAAAFLRSEEKKSLGGTDFEVSFDIVTVVLYDKNTEVKYYPQAFIPTYV